MPNAYPMDSKFTRNGQLINIDLDKIIKNPKSKKNVRVQAGDRLVINNKPNTIQLIGEINAPGYYKYNPGFRINDVLGQAGGLSNNADIDNIFVTFPNGKSKKYSRLFSNPKVLDGSVITIGSKPEEEPFDRTEYLKELSSIIANFCLSLWFKDKDKSLSLSLDALS
mgnify:CR=1 FL=1